MEADSASTAALAAAENAAAATPGVAAISNSYGGSEVAAETATDSSYDHPGIAVTASSGDGGCGVEYPAASPYVRAETVLAAGSRLREADGRRRLGRRRPPPGLAIYDTDNTCGSSSECDTLIELGAVQGLDGWAQVGGTSLSSPLTASVYALAGNTASIDNGSYPYAQAGPLFDVTSGSNGSCSGSYLCTAGAGYDGPTGLGTPDGTGAF